MKSLQLFSLVSLIGHTPKGLFARVHLSADILSQRGISGMLVITPGVYDFLPEGTTRPHTHRRHADPRLSIEEPHFGFKVFAPDALAKLLFGVSERYEEIPLQEDEHAFGIAVIDRVAATATSRFRDEGRDCAYVLISGSVGRNILTKVVQYYGTKDIVGMDKSHVRTLMELRPWLSESSDTFDVAGACPNYRGSGGPAELAFVDDAA